MSILMIFILGIGLSFDTFAVSVSCGILDDKITFWQASRIALFFAFFQALMPVLGWFLGYSIKDYVIQFDHWIAFSLLAFLGFKMIFESFKNEDKSYINPHEIKVILTLSLATTIDAFIVGVSFAFISINLALAACIIGFVTFLAAMLGMLFGKSIGNHFGRRIEIVGGLILVAIGVKILLDHIL